MHGGKHPSGIAHHNFGNGRYSKDMPAQLLERYNQYQADPDALSLKPDVALLRTLAGRQLSQIGTEKGDNNPAWEEAYNAWIELSNAMDKADAEKMISSRDKLGSFIKPQYRAVKAEAKLTDYIMKVGNIADKERRLLIDRQQMVTVEQVMITLTSFIMAVRESVLKHADKKTGQKILYDTDAAYSLTVNAGLDTESVDAE